MRVGREECSGAAQRYITSIEFRGGRQLGQKMLPPPWLVVGWELESVRVSSILLGFQSFELNSLTAQIFSWLIVLFRTKFVISFSYRGGGQSFKQTPPTTLGAAQ